MKFNLKKELPLLLLSFLPAALLMFVWNELPTRVPLHWGINGEVNRFGSKWELLFVVLIPIFLYALLLLTPLIDPKKRIQNMGNKFYTIRLITGLFLTVIFCFIIYSVKEQSLGNPNYLFILIGAFFVLLGNYFKTIKPNYFVGIRTPWTLENETIWKSTHKLAGKFWVAGGLAIIVSCLVFNQQTALIIFIAVTAIITLVPIVYSYLQFKKIGSIIILLLISSSAFSQEKPNRPQTPKAPFLYNIEEVSFQNMKDSVTLVGTFTYPQKGNHFPVAIFISGSGPQNRDSEIFDHKSFWVLADYLTKNGIAVLRYDDRGVGKSTGDFSKATSTDFAGDVVAAIDYLKTKSEIDPKKIGLIGHSEGGTIAPKVASENHDVAFVVTMAGVMIPGSELMLLQKEMQLHGVDASEVYITKEIEFDTGIMKIINTSETDSLNGNLEIYITAYFKNNPEFVSNHGLNEAYYKKLLLTSYTNPWLSTFIKHNPKNSLENLNCPLLALNGEKDLQVPAKENFEALRLVSENDTSKNFTLKSYPNLKPSVSRMQKGNCAGICTN